MIAAINLCVLKAKLNYYLNRAPRLYLANLADTLAADLLSTQDEPNTSATQAEANQATPVTFSDPWLEWASANNIPVANLPIGRPRIIISDSGAYLVRYLHVVDASPIIARQGHQTG